MTFRYSCKAVPYVNAVHRFGIEPILLSPSEEIPGQDLDGLLLSGGRDLDPTLYGQPPHALTAPPDTLRDQFELGLLRDALRRCIPILAICRGMQLLNVARGGTLHQHIEGHEVSTDHASQPAHEIAVSSGTRLLAALDRSRVPVNSRHHQAIDRLGTGLAVSALADDGTVEAIEDPDLPFVIGVQWHPEDQVDRCPQQERLFAAFAGALTRSLSCV